MLNKKNFLLAKKKREKLPKISKCCKTKEINFLIFCFSIHLIHFYIILIINNINKIIF